MVFFNNLVEIKRPRKGDENGRTIISTVLPTGRNKETPERGRKHIFITLFITSTLVEIKRPRKGDENERILTSQ